MTEEKSVLNEKKAGTDPETGETGIQAATRVKTQKFCRKCGKLMTFSFEKNTWICPSGCTQ